jgi:hypothetical protein
MNDRMDEYLARLPGESPAADLAVRIIALVAARRRVQAFWRRIGALVLVGLAAGASLVALSWGEATSMLASNLAPEGGTALSEIIEGYLTSPLDSVSSGIQSVVSLQDILAEGIGVAFLLGIVMLAIAAFGGLARLLQHSPSANGYSHSTGR